MQQRGCGVFPVFAALTSLSGYRPVASFHPLSCAGADAEFGYVLQARRTAPPRLRRKERLRRASGLAAKPTRATPVRRMPGRSTYDVGPANTGKNAAPTLLHLFAAHS